MNGDVSRLRRTHQVNTNEGSFGRCRIRLFLVGSWGRVSPFWCTYVDLVIIVHSVQDSVIDRVGRVGQDVTLFLSETLDGSRDP